MVSPVIFSKKSDDWATPPDFLVKLAQEFPISFDPCPLNATHDALAPDFVWRDCVFINPPYSNIRKFLEKGLEELRLGNVHTLIYLVPARTDVKWFHEVALPAKPEIRFIKGRLKFGGGKNSAPFPSMLLIFKVR